MKPYTYLLFLVLVSLLLAAVGCADTTEYNERGDLSPMDVTTCFKQGGTEYQHGLSGGYRHRVCVWKKENK